MTRSRWQTLNKRLSDTKRISVALSGGGYRATVWGLGVLLRLVDCGANSHVVSVASVSGGSIANGVVAQELDFSAANTEAFEAAVRPALQHIAHEGLFPLGKRTKWYTATICSLAGITTVLLAAIVIDFLVISFGGPRFAVATAALIVAFVIASVLLVLIFSRRSAVIDRALALTHFHNEHGRPTLLKDVDRATHHIFCATELQAADHFYFTPRTVYNYRLGSGTPGDLRLSTAVQCSACLPGGFSPRSLNPAQFGFRRSQDLSIPTTTPEQLVLSDGGVYDNMADQWDYGFHERAKHWPALLRVQRAAEILVVANASAGWTWKGIRRLGLLRAEIVGLLRPIKVMYDVTTSRRRFELVERFTLAELSGEGLRGVLIHIAQSPYSVPNRMLHDRNPARAKRAAEALAFLSKTAKHQRFWQEQAEANSGVGTVLGALGKGTTVDLLEHAYLLTMVNLYVVLGVGTLQAVDRNRFAVLCEK